MTAAIHFLWAGDLLASPGASPGASSSEPPMTGRSIMGVSLGVGDSVAVVHEAEGTASSLAASVTVEYSYRASPWLDFGTNLGYRHTGLVPQPRLDPSVDIMVLLGCFRPHLLRSNTDWGFPALVRGATEWGLDLCGGGSALSVESSKAPGRWVGWAASIGGDYRVWLKANLAVQVAAALEAGSAYRTHSVPSAYSDYESSTAAFAALSLLVEVLMRL